MRSATMNSKPVIRLKNAKEAPKIQEERKTNSILDRIVKPGDKPKRNLSRVESKTEENYEKITKKLKSEVEKE